MLRNEILFGDPTYQNTLAAIESNVERYNKTGDLDALVALIQLHLGLEREEAAREHIRKLRSHAATDASVEILTAVLTARLYGEIVDVEYHEDDVLYALELFEKNETTNQLFSYFDHCSYVLHWPDLMRTYLTALEQRWKESRSTGDPDAEAEPRRGNWTAFKELPRFDPEFVGTADAGTLRLMKRHDELLLSIVGYTDDPLALVPVFSSTYVLIWRKALHLRLPDKLEGYLEGVPRHAWRHDSPYDYTNEMPMERLIEEFPQDEGEIGARLSTEPSVPDHSARASDDVSEG